METIAAIALVNNDQLTQLQSLNDSYALNRTSYTNATNAVNNLLVKIEANGMNDELDSEANNLLVKLRTTREAMSARRTPYTKLFDEIRSRFTELEGAFDPSKKDSHYAKLQSHRDALANQKLEEQKAKEAEARAKLLRATEVSNAEAACYAQITTLFESLLTERKAELLRHLNAATLENIDTQANVIKVLRPTVGREVFDTFGNIVAFARSYISQEEFFTILGNTKNERYAFLNSRYTSEMQEYRDELIAKIPGKKTELQALAAASEEEALRIEEQKKAREAAEAAELAAKEAEANRAAATSAEGIKAAGSLNAMAEAVLPFDDAPAAQVRGSQEISVLNPAGWLLIVQFYFEREGLKETPEKLEKKTLASMKGFCEKWAQKTDERIVSPYLAYRDTVKSVAKK